MLDMQVALCGASQRDQRHASQNCGASQRLATPRNASQRLATRLRHACRGLDTLNGRGATRRPEKSKNQTQCTEDIVLHRRMRLRQHVNSNQQRNQDSAPPGALPCAPSRVAADHCGGLETLVIVKHMSLYSAELTTAPKSVVSPHKRG